MAKKGVAESPAVSVSLTSAAAEAAEGVSLLQQAQVLTIVDRVSHEAARTFLKGVKALKRKIEDHYAAIKKPLNDARATVLDMERKDLAPVLQAIELAERADTGYVREQQRIEAAEREAERQRLEAEERERRRVAAEQAEAEALKLEEASDALSAREQNFVSLVVSKMLFAESRGATLSPNEWITAATVAGYKSAAQQVKKLMASDKIQTAITNARKAAEVRQQAAAKQAAPITVVVEDKPSEVATVAGTSIRTYYACDPDVNVAALVKLAAADPRFLAALQPNLVYLNGEARQLREMFENVYKGACKLKTKDGVTA